MTSSGREGSAIVRDDVAAVELLDDDRLTLAGLISESYTGLRGTLERRMLEDAGIHLQWFVLLLRLARSPDHRLRMSDLADQTSLTPSGLSRAVDRLVEVGYVEREECPEDRRGAYAAVTSKGLRQVLDAVIPHLRHLDESLLDILTDTEQRQLASILRKVRDHVNPGAARPPAPVYAPRKPPAAVADR